jgi:hypothetical protein
MYIVEMGRGDLEYSRLAQDRFVAGSHAHKNVSTCCIRSAGFTMKTDYSSFQRIAQLHGASNLETHCYLLKILFFMLVIL